MAYQGLQGVTGELKGFLALTKGDMGLQGVTRSYMGL